MMFAEIETVVFETTYCCSCQVRFALTVQHMARLREVGSMFHCPNGHEISFSESTVKRLERRLSETSRKLVAVNCELLNEQSERQKAERKVKRCRNGVCPFCNRHFSALERHIKTKHPESKRP